MNKGVASLGVILVILAAFMFYIVFANGTLAGLVVTGTNATANFLAFLYVIFALPIGCGLAYAGLAYRAPIYAAGGQSSVSSTGSRMGGPALAIGIIALIVAFAAIGVAFSYHPSPSSSGASNSAVSSLSSEVASLQSQVSSVSSAQASGGGSGAGGVNQAPSVVPLKVEWYNNENAGQDRFSPHTITVNQGDIVQILFLSNDTDAHTFTLQTAPYSFQINLSFTGAHDFVQNTLEAGNCVNGTAAQDTSGISGVYCVSGTSLLSPSQLASNSANLDAAQFGIAQNTNPAVSPANLVILNVNNAVVYNNATSAAIGAGTVGLWGIGAFQATAPGIYEYFCHYHVSNGMFGYLIVLPNAYCTSHASACNVQGS